MQLLVIRGLSHTAAAKTVWFLLQLISVAGVLAVALLVMGKAGSWQNEFARYAAGGENLLKKTTASLEQAMPVLKGMDLSAQADQNFRQFTDRFAEKKVLPVVWQLFKWLPSLLLVPYVTYFLLNDSARLKKYIIKSVPNAYFEKALLLFARLDASLQNYFQGLLLLTLLDTLCLGLALEVLGMVNGLWLGLAAAVLAWIPYIGSIIGCVLVVLIAATDYPEKPGMAYACLVLFLGVRVLDDFVFMPLTIGRKLHVHPVMSVLMLLLGATVAGATGLILALPLFGVIAVIGDIVAQVMADDRLAARYRAARKLAALHAKV